MTQVVSVTEEIGRHDAWLRQLAKEDATLKQLTAIPSVGPLVAFALVLCIDDAHPWTPGKRGDVVAVGKNWLPEDDIEETKAVDRTGPLIDQA